METTKSFKEVTKQEFYASDMFCKKDCVLPLSGNWPYTGLWKERGTGALMGKTTEEFTDGIKNKYPMIKRYFLTA